MLEIGVADWPCAVGKEPPATEEDSTTPAPALDGAWKIHDAQGSWIEKADVKASIILALETAILGFVTVLSTDGRALTGLHGPRRAVDVAGVALLLISTLFSLSAIIPQLGRRGEARQDPGIIYFGHLRRWTSADLTDALRQGRPTNEWECQVNLAPPCASEMAPPW